MALHDPDSTAKEKAIALKIGRQKKIQIIDGKKHLLDFVHSFYAFHNITFAFDSKMIFHVKIGQQVEVFGEEDDEMEDYENEDIILDESALEGEQGTSGNVMAVQV